MSLPIVILTGAGISQESGIPTFRGADGLWHGHRVEDVATWDAFCRQPALVHEFYNMRRRALLQSQIQPNAAHVALARLERELPPGTCLVVTQNIDDLHLRAGTRNLVCMHGELLKARCLDTDEVFDWRNDLSLTTPHPRFPDDPQWQGRLRPHIVWFGEMPFGMPEIEAAVARCATFVAIGTSGNVYPAAGLVRGTRSRSRRIEINLEDTPVATAFDEKIRGPASVEVPRWVDRFLTTHAGGQQ
jgi:NAD-dependent deacetylase